MSYILEALRKADAEREQGAEPVLPGPAARADALPERPEPRADRAWRWLAAGAAIPIAALLAWKLGSAPESVPAAAVTSTTPATPAPAPAPAPALAPTPTPTLTLTPGSASTSASASGPASAPASASASGPAATAATPPPATRAIAMAEPATAPPSTADAASAATPAASAPVARAVRKAAARPAAPPAQRAPAASQPPAAVPPLAALPDELRRQVPAMVIGGSVYSPDPASRMLVVNGQVVREGTTLAPGLRLERIGRQTAVFSIRGQNFELRL